MHRQTIALLAVVLAGCASPSHWRNPELPPGQASADERVCRREAEEDMGPQPYSPPGSEKYDTPMQMIDRSEERGQFESLVNACMERKGYRHVN